MSVSRERKIAVVLQYTVTVNLPETTDPEEWYLSEIMADGLAATVVTDWKVSGDRAVRIEEIDQGITTVELDGVFDRLISDN